MNTELDETAFIEQQIGREKNPVFFYTAQRGGPAWQSHRIPVAVLNPTQALQEKMLLQHVVQKLYWRCTHKKPWIVRAWSFQPEDPRGGPDIGLLSPSEHKSQAGAEPFPPRLEGDTPGWCPGSVTLGTLPNLSNLQVPHL